MMNLCLAVTADRYELPMAVCESRQELAALLGITPEIIKYDLYKQRKKKNSNLGAKRGYRFIEVEVDDEEYEQ